MMDILIVGIERQHYGLRLADVREILLAVAVTELPGGPPVVEGVVDVRGSLVPVFDLRRRFRLPVRGVSPHDHFVLASAGEREVLLHVDRAERVATVDPASLEDAGDAVPGVEHIEGVARVGDDLVLIHDLRGFLAGAEKDRLDAALQAFDRSGPDPS